MRKCVVEDIKNNFLFFFFAFSFVDFFPQSQKKFLRMRPRLRRWPWADVFLNFFPIVTALDQSFNEERVLLFSPPAVVDVWFVVVCESHIGVVAVMIRFHLYFVIFFWEIWVMDLFLFLDAAYIGNFIFYFCTLILNRGFECTIAMFYSLTV